MFYFDLLKKLYETEVNYLIVGGLAVNLHGIPRVTQDIDLIILMTKENIKKVLAILSKLNYIPRLPINAEGLLNPNIVRKWISERNLKALSFYQKVENYKGVDILLVHPLDFEKAFKNRITKEFQNTEIYLVNIDDLITMKAMSGRNQDLSDIEMLKKIRVFMEEE